MIVLFILAKRVLSIIINTHILTLFLFVFVFCLYIVIVIPTSMNCFTSNIIVTVALVTHGVVVNLKLTPETQSLFENVRLFSKAGEFQPVCANPMEDVLVLRPLYKHFRKELTSETLQTLKEYSQMQKQNASSCGIFEHITVDKILTIDKPTPYAMLRDFQEFSGIFLISIHRKVAENTYQLVWPTEKGDSAMNVDLLNLHNLKKLDTLIPSASPNKELIDTLDSLSVPLDHSEFSNRIFRIEHGSFTKEEKQALLQKEQANFYQEMKDFQIEIDHSSGFIVGIRLSFLVHIIRTLIGQPCSINLLDYSCNHTTQWMPSGEQVFSSYMVPSDIENPPPYSRTWGGTRRKRKRKTRQQKTRPRKSRPRKTRQQKGKKFSKK